MVNFIKNIKKYFGLVNISALVATKNNIMFRPAYRVVLIEKGKQGNYIAVVQVIGKASIFKLSPEEILADDKMTNQFSPTDIRTLTYLGYLGINTPKYEILAKRLSEKDNKMLFALHKKGDKFTQVKNANEISKNKEIIKQMNQEDAHMIGYVVATERLSQENMEKEKLRKQYEKNN